MRSLIPAAAALRASPCGVSRANIAGDPARDRQRAMPKMQYKVKGETFEVDDRYEVKKKIGAGAYGLLCAATDKHASETVAVKKIKDAFDDAIDCKRTLREVRLLQHFQHENVLNLRDIMLDRKSVV